MAESTWRATPNGCAAGTLTGKERLGQTKWRGRAATSTIAKCRSTSCGTGRGQELPDIPVGDEDSLANARHGSTSDFTDVDVLLQSLLPDYGDVEQRSGPATMPARARADESFQSYNSNGSKLDRRTILEALRRHQHPVRLDVCLPRADDLAQHKAAKMGHKRGAGLYMRSKRNWAKPTYLKDLPRHGRPAASCRIAACCPPAKCAAVLVRFLACGRGTDRHLSSRSAGHPRRERRMEPTDIRMRSTKYGLGAGASLPPSS